MQPHPEVAIEPATAADAPLILEFIKELAAYEKLEGEVTATESDIRETLFGSDAYAESLIARVKDRPVGFALFFHNYSTFLGRPGLYLEDLYVRPQARGKGVGAALLKRIARIAVERGCGRMDWWVLDWNKPAIEFYERVGARGMKDWTLFRLKGESLERLGTEE